MTVNGTGAWSYTMNPLQSGGYAFSADDTLAGLTSALSNTVDVTVATVGHGHHNDFGH